MRKKSDILQKKNFFPTKSADLLFASDFMIHFNSTSWVKYVTKPEKTREIAGYQKNGQEFVERLSEVWR
jgi:hypothetical protein